MNNHFLSPDRNFRLAPLFFLALLGVVVFCSQALAAAPAPIGGERMFNYNNGQTQDTAIGVLGSGAYILAWARYENNSYNIYAQRFDVNDDTVGDVFRVNQTLNSFARYPRFSTLAGGGVVLSWLGNDGDVHMNDVQCRVFDANGNMIGSQIRANEYFWSPQRNQSVAGLADGGFVVAWESNGHYGDNFSTGVYAAVFNADGSERTSEFLVNSFTGGRRSALFGPQESQEKPSVAALANGGFVIAWQSFRDMNASWGIAAQRYDRDGVTQGGEFVVHTSTEKSQTSPKVAGLTGGGFIVVWQSQHDAAANGMEIMGQRFDDNGVKVGGEFVANSAPGGQYAPELVSLSNGGFVAAWRVSAQDGDMYGLFGQEFDAAGGANGVEFQINTYYTGYQSAVELSRHPVQGFFASWEYSSSGFPKKYGISFQRFGGVANSPVAAVSQKPAFDSAEGEIDFVVGGSDVTAYKFAVDNGAFGAETAVAQKITLSAATLSEGLHTLHVIGKNNSDAWQAQNQATSLAFTVVAPAPQPQPTPTPQPSTAPVVSTKVVTAVGMSSVTTGGNVTSEGSASVTGRGVCWSTSQRPTIADSKSEDGAGLGDFTSTINNLQPGTRYFARAYATNSHGTSYGAQVSFRTTFSDASPTVTTTDVSSITAGRAVSGGEVASAGGAAVFARGVCWSTSNPPTIENRRTRDGRGPGSFASHITGLNENTTYYVRAYAVNVLGVAYGDTVEFTTTARPSITGFSPSAGTEGDSITITGAGFENVTQVFFGGTAAQSFTVESATSITAVVGGGTTGPVGVVTASGLNLSQETFTYEGAAEAPTITSFTPGAAARNNGVMIWGANFTDASAVTFGGTPAAGFTVLNDTLIKARIGDGATGVIEVTTPSGAAVSSEALAYTGEAQLHLVLANTNDGRHRHAHFLGGVLQSLDDLNESFSGEKRCRAVGDFNNDGKADMVLHDSESGDAFLYSLTDGFETNGQTELDMKIPAPWEVIVSGDYNNDGAMDIVCRNADTGAIGVVYLNADFTKQGIQMFPMQVSPDWVLTAADDMNEDGLPDLIFQHEGTGKIAVAYMGGDFSKSGVKILDMDVPPAWRVAGACDFNNDGVLDLILKNSGINKLATIYLKADFIADGYCVLDGMGDWSQEGWDVVSTGEIF